MLDTINSMKISHRLFIGILLGISLGLHLVGIWHPQQAVFDEVHFGKFVSGYLKGEYFFDIHPPLGKLMIAGVARIARIVPTSAFQTIGETYIDYQYIWLRLLPALLGSFLAPLFYLLTLRLSSSLWAARLSGFFVLFENALLVQSKFILIDSFLLVFGFSALYVSLESKIFFEDRKWGVGGVIASGCLAGFAISIKWTAISFWGLMLAMGLIHLLRGVWIRDKKRFMPMLGAYAFLIAFPLAIYMSFFFLHFKLLPKSGPGNAYMNERFGRSQTAEYPLRDFFTNFYDLNREMFSANQRITSTHAYSSRWYTWPLMHRSVYYWNEDINKGDMMEYRRIYFLGNPFVWWFSTATLAWFFLMYGGRILFRVKGLWSKKKTTGDAAGQRGYPRWHDALLASGYLLNLLPFIFIGRVMFLYHYLTALLFAIIIASTRFVVWTRTQQAIACVCVVGTLAAFIIIYPVTYGAPFSTPWPRYIFWLKSWI